MDYVAGWFMKAAEHIGKKSNSAAAFVSTNSICQGRQVATIWPLIFAAGHDIIFAHTSFKWANLASHNAGVTVVIIGISNLKIVNKKIYAINEDGTASAKNTSFINAYLTPSANIIVKQQSTALSNLSNMTFGNMANDGGGLLVEFSEYQNVVKNLNVKESYIILVPFYGSSEFIKGIEKRCIWVKESEFEEASKNQWLANSFELVRNARVNSSRETTKKLAKYPYSFGEVRQTGNETVLIIPRVSSERREYLPVGLLPENSIAADSTFAIFDSPLWNMALIGSRMHLVWIAAVCGKLKTDFRYSNTLGWNAFPVPNLTREKQSRFNTLCGGYFAC